MRTGSTRLRSFGVAMPTCPDCASSRTTLSLLAISNMLRVPAGVVFARWTGRSPFRFVFRCRNCRARFLGDPN